MMSAHRGERPLQRRKPAATSTSKLVVRSRRDANRLFLAALFLITNILTTAVVDGANNNHNTGNGHSNGGSHGSNGHGNGPPASPQDAEPETFEDHVNITLPPNSKQISYWMYSMKTPGHIDMSHLLFHTTDDENNISEDTKNSAIDVVVFRVADYIPFCGSTPAEINACGGGLGDPFWRSCDLERDFDEQGNAFPNNDDGCEMPYDEKDFWHKLGFGGYRDASLDDNDDTSNSTALSGNNTDIDGDNDEPTGGDTAVETPDQVLEWCCTDPAIDAGLCPKNHHGRILVNETIFQGNHRYIPISRITSISTGLRNAKILQPYTNGTYVVAMANCNRHGRPMEVLGKWTWDPLKPNATDDSENNGEDGGNTTTPTTPDDSGSETRSPTETPNDASNNTSSSNDTNVPPPTSAPHPTHGSGSSPSSAPHAAPHSSPTSGSGSSPSSAPHSTPHSSPTSGSGGSSSHHPTLPTSGGGHPTSMGSPNNSNTSNLPSGDTAKFGIAAIGALLCVAVVSFIVIRQRRHKHHLVGGADMQFNDLELVESRKQQHYTDYGENGYLPNFS